MSNLNFKHLRYFWAVAANGSIARAADILHLTPQTISGQLSLLEEYLGVDLLSRVGRNLELTDTGRMVLSYADEIFSLGGELEEVIHQWPDGRPQVSRLAWSMCCPSPLPIVFSSLRCRCRSPCA